MLRASLPQEMLAKLSQLGIWLGRLAACRHESVTQSKTDGWCIDCGARATLTPAGEIAVWQQPAALEQIRRVLFELTPPPPGEAHPMDKLVETATVKRTRQSKPTPPKGANGNA